MTFTSTPRRQLSVSGPAGSRTARLAWALFAVSVVLAGYELVLGFPVAGDPLTAAFAVVDKVLNAGFVVAFGAVGALIVGQQPRNAIGWLLMVIGQALAWLGALLAYWGLNSASPSGPSSLLAVWLNTWGWWFLIGPLLLILLLFPTGRPPSPRWRWVIVLLAATFLLFFVLATFGVTLGNSAATPPLRNPIGFIPDALVEAILAPFAVLLSASALLCASAVFVRYRRASLVERQQIKWLLLAGGLFAAIYLVAGIQSDSDFGTFFSSIFDLGVLAIPAAIGIAVLRYRLYDIDVIIRRTLVYAVLTAVLAVAYLVSVLVLQTAFGMLTGQSQSALVTVLSTLLIAALFVPLRRRVQAAIDRRFFRRKYDAARTLAGFAATLRDETNLEQLSAHLTAVVDETMQPATVGLWLRAPESGQP